MKNTKRYVSDDTKYEVYERDGGKCVLCGKSYPLERTPHHIYFGYYANRNKNRNDADQLVTICIEEHAEIHFKGDPKNKRQKCIDYINTYYNIN